MQYAVQESQSRSFSYQVSAVTAVGLASLFYVYDYFIQVSPSVMTNQLMRDFSIGAAGIGFLGSCFYYSYTLMQIPAGLLLDRLGPRVLLTFSVFVSAVGVTLFGWTDSFFLAALSRFLIGLGSAFAFISALFLASRWFAHHYFPLVAGLVQLGGCLGSMLGEAPLAIAIGHYGWRQTMVVMGLLTFFLTLVFWFGIKNGRQTDSPQFSMRASTEWHRLNYVIRQPQIWWIALCGFMSWVPMATIGALWGVDYFVRVYHLTHIQAAQLCSMLWLGLGIGSPIIGWLSSRTQRRRTPILCCFMIGFIASIALIQAPSLPIWVMCFVLLLLGFSASVQTLTFGYLKDIVSPDVFGTASGFNNMAAIIGGAVSLVSVGLIVEFLWDGEMVNNIPVYQQMNYQVAFILLAISALLGILIARFKLKETYCKETGKGQQF